MTLAVINQLSPDITCRAVVEAGVRDALQSCAAPWRVTISRSSSDGRVAIDILTGAGAILCMSIAETDTREQIAAHIRQFTIL